MENRILRARAEMIGSALNHLCFLVSSRRSSELWLGKQVSGVPDYVGIKKMSKHGCPKYSQISIPRVTRTLLKPVVELKSTS